MSEIKLTKKQEQEIRKYLNTHKDETYASILNEARVIYDITRGKSGFFGIPFMILIPYLEQKVQSNV